MVACGAGVDDWVWEPLRAGEGAPDARLLHNASGQCLTRRASSSGATGSVGVLTLENCSTYLLFNRQAAPDPNQQWLSLPTNTSERLAEIQPPLRVVGRDVVDARGVRVKLSGTNWAGAHQEQRVNGGLEFMHVREIAKIMRRMGFTHVRMNYAVEMMWDTVPVNDSALAANPQLFNSTPWQVFDACIDALTAEGLLVVINAHNSDYRWCCSLIDDQGLWYNSRWPESKFFESLTMIAARHRNNPRVIGYDVRNEPRPNMPTGSSDPTLIWWDPEASWPPCSSVSVHLGQDLRVDLGSFSARGVCLKEHTANLRKAMEQGSMAVWHGDPDALVFISGVGGGELVNVIEQPLRFKQSCLHSRVVYTVHDYPWAERWFDLSLLLKEGSGSFGDLYSRAYSIYSSPGARSLNESLRLKREAWGFLVEQNLAPVWVGEFGWYSSEGSWWDAFLAYATQLDLDWAWWKFIGVKYPPYTRFANNGDYFDSGQFISAPGGVTQTYYEDFFGLTAFHPDVATHADRLQAIIDLAPITKGPGIAGAPPATLPGQCDFDPTLHPVVGTGQLPRGFAAYGSVVRDPSCPAAGSARRLSHNGTMHIMSLPELVEDSDRALVSRLRADRSENCAGTESVEIIIGGEKREEGYDRLHAIAGRSENPIDRALRIMESQDAQRTLREHVEALDRIISIFYWLLGGIIAAGVAVWVLYCMARKRCHEAKHFLRWAMTPVLGPHIPRSERRDVDRSLAHPRDLAWLEKLEQRWRFIIVVDFVVLCVMLYFFVYELQGNNLLSYGASRMWCALSSVADEALSGASGSFIGFFPALEKVHAFATDLHDPHGIRNELTQLLQQLGELQSARTQAGARLEEVRAAVLQPLGQCALGEPIVGLLNSAQGSIGRSIEFVLADMGVGVLTSLGGQASTALEEDLTRLLDPLREVKTIVVGTFANFYDGSVHQNVMNGMTIGIRVALGLALLVIPLMVLEFFASFRLLLNTYCGHRSCFQPYSEKPPHFACAVWACGTIFGAVSLAVAVILAFASREGAHFCAVADTALDGGLDPYLPALGVPAQTFVSAATAGVFQTCFARGGTGQLLDVIRFDGCSAGSSIATADSLRGRLQAVNSSLNGWLTTLDQHVSGGIAVSSSAEVLALYAGLENLPSGNGTAGYDAGVAACTAARAASGGNITYYDCPAVPPRLMPGLCEGQELANRTAALKSRLDASLKRVEAATANVTGTILRDVSRSVSDRIFAKVLMLLDKLDCGQLGAHVQDLVDSTCVGIILGLREVSFANYGLCGTSWFLALTTYFFWKHFAHAYDVLHKNSASPKDGGAEHPPAAADMGAPESGAVVSI